MLHSTVDLSPASRRMGMQGNDPTGELFRGLTRYMYNARLQDEELEFATRETYKSNVVSLSIPMNRNV